MQPLFPKNFLWGAATSAHQVEGNTHNNWTEWEKRGLVRNGERSGRAVDHYHRFRDDLRLAKELGHTAYRFSIEWSRIMPKPGLVDTHELDHYREMLATMRNLGLEPIVTLHHFTHPVWVDAYGAWLNRRIVDDFGRFVFAVITALGPESKYWITINEPTVLSSLSYLSRWWPPQRGSWVHAWTAIRQMVRAHTLAYHVIHRYQPAAKVGVANNLSNFVPSRPRSALDRSLRGFAHYWHNRWWLDQTYPTQDFIGLNYYFHHPIRFKIANLTNLLKPEPRPEAPRNDLGWEMNPVGLGQLLVWLKQYQRPIIITENGVADAEDRYRAQFIRDHVAQIQSAVAAGVDVRGYLHWSLLDNFEWREGFGPRFGLIEVDYHTLKRAVRPSAYAFREIIERNRAA